MNAFDAEIASKVREIAARHEALHEKLSRAIGPVANYQSMTLAQLATVGLEKLGIEIPDDDDDPVIVCLETALRGRGSGLGAGMDAAPPGSLADKLLKHYSL